MAFTVTGTSSNGMDLVKRLAQGTYIDAFDYDMFQEPDTAQSLVMPYGSDLLGFQQLAGYVAYDDMASDELAWFETGRLLKSYSGITVAAASKMTLPANNDVRVGDTLQLASAAGGAIIEAVVTAAAANGVDFTLASRSAAAVVQKADYKVIHVGTEFKKGTDAQDETLTREGKRRTNKPIILKDSVLYSRSDLNQLVQFSEADDSLWSIDTSDMETRFQNQQVMAGVWGNTSAAASGATSAGLGGMESLNETVLSEGNSISGGAIGSLDDIQSITRMLTANKSPKEYLMLQDLKNHQGLTKALGGINRHDSGAYNFGSFANVGDKMLDLNFRGFDSDGFIFAYKTWDVLNDKMYYGAFDDMAAKPRGMMIPAGEAPTAKGEVLPYFSFVYRRGARRIVGHDGQVFNQGTKDVAKLAYTAEFTTRTTSPKDFTVFKA